MGASDARSDIRASAWEIALMRNDIGDGGRFLQSTQPEYRDSGLHQRHLCHIDAAATKAALAIHQIIAPEIDEARIELRRQFACVHCGVEIYAPAAERFGIMLAEMMRIAPIEALRLRKGAEARFGQQHAARKNIRLDEIGAGCIANAYGVIDAGILDSCTGSRVHQ